LSSAMNHSYSLKCDNLKLVPLSAAESEKYRLLRNQAEIRKWFEYKGKISKEQQNKWFDKYLDNQSDIMFAIMSENGAFLGCNSIYNINPAAGRAEYGRLIIDPKYSGKGYGCLATKMAVCIARNQMGLSELQLEVYENNFSAIKSYHKAGFIDNGFVFDKSGNRMLSMSINFKNEGE
jgi:RimJ/RimL family protein N-acetyltransferase